MLLPKNLSTSFCLEMEIKQLVSSGRLKINRYRSSEDSKWVLEVEKQPKINTAVETENSIYFGSLEVFIEGGRVAHPESFHILVMT